MALINGIQLSKVRIVRIEGIFHKLPHVSITRKTSENRGSSALSALIPFVRVVFMARNCRDVFCELDKAGEMQR